MVDFMGPMLLTDRVPLGVAFGLGPVLIAAGGLVVWLGARAASGSLHRNPLIGIRTSETLRSDQAWEQAHRAGGPWIIGAGSAPVLAGLVLLFRPPSGLGPPLIMAAMAIMVAVLAAGTFVATQAARNAP